jgi:hypothetical protein
VPPRHATPRITAAAGRGNYMTRAIPNAPFGVWPSWLVRLISSGTSWASEYPHDPQRYRE